jgi:hypothetical protein
MSHSQLQGNGGKLINKPGTEDTVIVNERDIRYSLSTIQVGYSCRQPLAHTPTVERSPVRVEGLGWVQMCISTQKIPPVPMIEKKKMPGRPPGRTYAHFFHFWDPTSLTLAVAA